MLFSIKTNHHPYMKTRFIRYNFYFVFLCCCFSFMDAFSQEKELESLRSSIYQFVQYDKGKIDSIPKNKQNDVRLKSALDLALMNFMLHKDSKNLDSLKQKAINNKTSFIIGNHNYFFHDLRKNPMIRSLENNVNHSIVFYGIYDYELSNFVSVFIQPCKIENKSLVIYYFKLNGSGNYYIKDIATNKIIFTSSALTSNAPIFALQTIDEKHYLLVEDMENNGQRAMVIENNTGNWKQAKAFKGKTFQNSLGPYTEKKDAGPRYFLRYAENKNIVSIYGSSFLKKYEIQFDEKTKILSYREYRKNEEHVVKKATWKNNVFVIDDYYIGEHINDEPMPFPG